MFLYLVPNLQTTPLLGLTRNTDFVATRADGTAVRLTHTLQRQAEEHHRLFPYLVPSLQTTPLLGLGATLAWLRSVVHTGLRAASGLLWYQSDDAWATQQ